MTDARIGALVALAMTAAGFAAGCAAERPYLWVHDLPATNEPSDIIELRDTLLVAVKNQPSLSGQFVVGDDGCYLEPTVGTVEVAGRSTAAVAQNLRDRLRDLVVSPDVSVSIVKLAPVRVNVVGEVRTPGAYELARGRGVLPALAAAGWLTEFADRDRIFVLRAGAGQRIRFRARELTAADARATGFRLRDGDVVVVE